MESAKLVRPLVRLQPEAASKVLEAPLLPDSPAITVLPAHPVDINRRALAQSRRYIAPLSKVRETTDSVRVDGQEDGDITGGVSV